MNGLSRSVDGYAELPVMSARLQIGTFILTCAKSLNPGFQLWQFLMEYGYSQLVPLNLQEYFDHRLSHKSKAKIINMETKQGDPYLAETEDLHF